MPLEASEVAAWLSLPADQDVELLADCVAAANGFVDTLPAVTGLPDGAEWPAIVLQGAKMLAARLYRRRNTPSGVESFTDGLIYLPRRDADVDLLLGTGRYAMPGVG